jgi:glucosylceramidase
MRTSIRLIVFVIGWLAAVPAGAQQVSVWLTTDDQRSRLEAQRAVAFAPASTADNPVVVDEARTYQTIEGFGASFTDSSAYLLNQVASPAARAEAMRRLFTREADGIGLSFIRNPMGASDLSRTHYSYDDLPAGQADPSLEHFSIAHDEQDIIPLVLEARRLNPQMKIMATPWSPPGWMKSSGAMIGGTLLPSMYDAFANYFVKYIQAYARAGIPIDYVSLQNEPLYVPADYPGMSMDGPTQLVVLRDHVLPAFLRNQVTTRLLVYDHNWDRPDHPETVLSDPAVYASPIVAGTAWHGYGGTPGVMLTTGERFPEKGQYQTEHSGGTWVTDQVREDFVEIIHVLRSGGRAFVKWGLALDQHRGPHAGGCGTCTPLVTVNASGAVSYPIDFYTLGHFSRFVLSGARRVHSSNGTGILTAAFVNPDGSKALVAVNDTKAAVTFQVRWGDKAFSYSLPGCAGATFTWSGTASGETAIDARRAIRASSFTASKGVQTEATTDTGGGLDAGFADGGDSLTYEHVDFGKGVTAVEARVASAGSGGTIEFHLDGPAGPLVGTVPVPVTGGWQQWTTVSGAISGANSVRSLALVFRGGQSVGNLNWFRFK